MARPLRHAACIALLCAVLGGTSARTATAKSNPAVLPPYAGVYQPQGADERGAWMEADESERKLRDSKFVIHDAALEAYVRQVLCNTVGTDRCNGVRIYIVRTAAFNASMAPNGMMQVWSGLLLRLRSEAELGGVLGHEFAHFEERHSLANYRHMRGATDVMAWAVVVGGPLVQFAALGSIFAFSREQETAADVHAFAYLAASRYRAGAEAEIWDRLMNEADASAIGRKQPSRRYDRASFLATHPTSFQRSAYLHKLDESAGNQGEDGEARYEAALSKWRGEFLADQVKLNDFEGTEYLLGQLARNGWTGELLFARGEVYRLRGHPRDLVSAAEFYRDAIAKGYQDPGVHRSLGMALLRGNATAEGCQELKRYLSLRPDASDAAMIAMLIDQSPAS
jgi:beta-barrel assembly-enhancing protease